MKVLVTGGLGFIGAATCAELRGQGHEVRVLDSLDPSVHPGADVQHACARAGVKSSDLVQADLLDPQALARALDGVDAVLHLAAKVGIEQSFQDLPEYVLTNTTGTAALLAAMHQAGTSLLVAASSMVVYGEGAYACIAHGPVAPRPREPRDLEAGDFEPRCACGLVLTPELVREDAPLAPSSAYALSKLQTEQLVELWARRGGRGALMRYHNVYGPGMPANTPYAGVASLWRSALARGEAPQVFEDGGQRRDFVHVSDVARANALALATAAEQSPGWVRAFNVGSGVVSTIGEVAAELSRAARGPAPEFPGRWRVEDVRHVTASSQRAREELNYQPQVSLAQGLTAFAQEPLRTGVPA